MADIVRFSPRRELTAELNVRAFVQLCRERLTVFGADLQFDATRWDITAVARRRASSSRLSLHFNRLGELPGGVPMRDPFGSFARAYLRYHQGLSPTICHGHRMQALRALEMALCNEMTQPQIHRATPSVFNAAAALLRSYLVAHGAYAASRQLETLGRFMDENGLVATPLTWVSPLNRPIAPRLGPEFEERRATTLPSRTALEGLAFAFRRAAEPSDVVVASAAALQFCAHSRICEVLTAPNRCEVASVKEDERTGHALRWWPAKGGKACLKWLLPSMAPIATRALDKIRRITEPARTIARWYEAHPDRLHLPRRLEHLRRREYITLREAAEITGVKRQSSYVRGLSFRWRSGMKEVRFADLEARLLALLPREFPIFDSLTGLKYSEALFVIPRSLFRGIPMHCMIERVSESHITAGLGCRSHLACSSASIFARLGLTEDDGTPLRLPSHRIRHYLSDLAQRNEVSQLDLAAWAGREPQQNLDYNHISDAERLAHVRTMLRSRNTWRGPQSELAQRMPVERSAFSRFSAPTIHTTEIGFCLHDFAMLPCPLHRDCIFCTELICIKGDARRAETVRRWLSENSALLVSARRAMSRRAYGADRWVTHCRKAVERLTELRGHLEDPAIPDGTVIQLGSPEMPSRIRDAALERNASLPPFPNPRLRLKGRTRAAEEE